MLTLDLNDRKLWTWQQVPTTSGEEDHSTATAPQSCAQFPSQIHAELLAAKLIPDPFVGRNEENVQWVGERDWLYICSFEVSASQLEAGEQADVCFEGLDTFATMFVNGDKVLEAENMHRQYRVALSSSLVAGENFLYIVFHSAFHRGRELEQQHLGKKHWPCWNGDASRLFVRKAGFNYGWDWGPVLMTAGPYRPIHLAIYTSRISDFWPRASVSANLEPKLSLSWKIDAPADLVSALSVRARILSSTGTAIKKVSLDVGMVDEHVWRFEKDEVELWWTAGLGKQPIYDVEVDLIDMRTGQVVHSVSKKVGFRRLRVVQEPLADEPGTTFLFELNNVPLFIGGSNWIPADSVLANAPEKRYRRLLEMMVEGNQNMVRVWGGGAYECDHFYRTCDELGILVWQDFAFACGAYPAHIDEFRENVRLEVKGVVKRLRSHACLAIFAGNNEDYQIAESEKLQYDSEDQDGNWLRTDFPARELYERVFPKLVADNSDVFYWPGSPWGGKPTTDSTVGDVHCWNVWHGTQEPYQRYGELGGRFVSEFGMQGAPDIRTIDTFLAGDKSERFPQSHTMAAHNKAAGFERRIAQYLTENIRSGASLEDYVFATQFIQSQALSMAFSAWRRNFKGGVEGASCAGALVWQLNDVWPCTSWSIIDSYLRPKPAYFSIRRALSALAISGRRYTTTTYPDPLSAAKHVDQSFVELWAGNSTLSKKDVEVEVEAFELLSGKSVFRERWSTVLKENRNFELKQLEVARSWDDEKKPLVVTARLRDGKTGDVLSRVSLYPEPYKFLSFPSSHDVNLRVSLNHDKGILNVLAARPVKGLVFSFSTDVKLSDNCVDLIPNEERIIEVERLTKETTVSWRYLGDEQCP